MESQEHIFMISSSVERTRGNRAINAAEDENYGEILKSGDNTLLRYKIFDGDGEILPMEGLPCEAVIKKDDKVVYRTPAEVDAENIVSFKITDVLPSDRNNPYTIEFIITQDQDTLIFPSDDRINLFIYPSSFSVDSDIIEQTPESRLNEIVIVAVNDAAQEIYLELDNIRATLSALDPDGTSGELQQIKDDIARIETDLANITPGNYDQEIQQINDELATINNALSTYETPSGAQEKANTAETNAKAYADSLLADAGGGVSSWNDLTDKPSTFTPSEHTHTMTDVNGLQAALDGLETTDGAQAKATAAESNANAYTDTQISNLPDPSWDEITGKPLDLETTSGAQAKADAAEQNAKSYADSVAVGGDAGPVTWETVQDKPLTFPPDTHTHPISQVTNLQTTLDGKETPAGAQSKADVAETNAKNYADAQIDAIPETTWTSLSGKPSNYPPSTHNHSIDEVLELRTELNSKETPSGAQAKADAAETSANAYTDNSISGLPELTWNNILNRPTLEELTGPPGEQGEPGRDGSLYDDTELREMIDEKPSVVFIDEAEFDAITDPDLNTFYVLLKGGN